MSSFRFEVWPTNHRIITQYFGANRQYYSQFHLPGHDGIDIRAPHRSQIFCVAPGKVYQVHNDAKGHNYGIHVRVQHTEGYKTIYAHLDQALVTNGQVVEAGTVLGLADNTGNSFGSHLHLALKKDNASQGDFPHNFIDPTPFLLPLLGWQEPAGPYIDGWVRRQTLFVIDTLAQVNAGGAQLYLGPDDHALLPEGTVVMVMSPETGNTPFVQVRVAQVALDGADPFPVPLPIPTAELPAAVSTVAGWGWADYMIRGGKQAVVSHHGLNLRAEASKESAILGLVKRGSLVEITGNRSGDYFPLRVRRSDFVGPVHLPAPGTGPLGEVFRGWAREAYVSTAGRQAIVRFAGIHLRNRPDKDAASIGLVKGFATISIIGAARNGYVPVVVRRDDMLNPANPMPEVQPPSGSPPTDTSTQPLPTIQDSTPGWMLTAGLTVLAENGTVKEPGYPLRAVPRRNAFVRGQVPAGTRVLVTGPQQGEYTPVRVNDDRLEPSPHGTADAPLLGHAFIGLHASADPAISEQEHQLFAEMRPGVIKVLSFHEFDDIARLAQAHPKARWVVRAFLSFGGREISPDQFIDYTLPDVQRSLRALSGRDVVVELHNEPNLYEEGLSHSWRNGTEFGYWLQELIKKCRHLLPGTRFIYPGLSPGNSVRGVRMDHIEFLEASRAAVNTADGLAVHLYWSHIYPMARALDVLDDTISRFRDKPIWITEASFHGTLPVAQRAQQYLTFWHELQKRATVQGITFFVASASNSQFANEVWLGTELGRMIGMR